MTELVQVALDLQAVCVERKWPFCIIGGLAVQHWGEPRFTKDVDFTILTGLGGEEPVVDGLLGLYQPRVRDARAFALENRVLLLQSSSGIGIDIALGALDFEVSAMNRAKELAVFGEIPLRLCSPEDLIIMKAFADRTIDWHDIEGILTRQGREALDWTYIYSHLEPLCEVKEAPEISARLRALQ
jgi:hypothetical protein